ncbi:Major facilitator superfamily domain, general substrate transporter [Metarhizium album ARSEF 1941]|uniref:Major facilitator superfamily domain, general substrate transporter n=1 Tax=Metarhizium album (strain ARSEF 1941) TaxID=1081103 RepID=A0A0B2WH25_METAS|nr:Major facilitator superfamily domain, general substrate transporter [Metarhizium album ARSEF 1941]KHN95286.1 Major facilitator superfamily domain, general substrate transporter [Metarhizium album ARSEF 1941]
MWRKTVNFTIISFYVLMTFVQLDISFTAWGKYQEELGFSVGVLNAGTAFNYSGLAVGCFVFVPLVHKYGRRPFYILSTAIQVAASIWAARTQNRVDLWVSNLLAGLGGSISESIVQITIADLFFVHHHAAMNGCYLFVVASGAFLGPVAAGYVVQNQGWRWMWWWCTILLGTGLVVILLFFEESKYLPAIEGHCQPSLPATLHGEPGQNQPEIAPHEVIPASPQKDKGRPVERTKSNVVLDAAIPMMPLRERLALFTRSEGSAYGNAWQPFRLLFTFPAITYTAVTYATTLAEFAIVTSVQAVYLLEPPYNFTSSGIGLMSLAPFIGTFPGIFVGGYLNDRSILWLSKRNGGIYEPEMRLWLALPSALLTPCSVLMVGLGIAYGTPWPLIAVGFGILGFNLGVTGSIALSYAMDCYHHIIGNAMVGIVFSRNVLSVVVLFTLTPWIAGMGLRNMHILVAVISSVVLLIPALLLVWGKKSRIALANTYTVMAQKQPTCRDF